MSKQRLTADQLARLEAARAAGEPVSADIRELVNTHHPLDGTETEGEIVEAARCLGYTIHDLFRETLARQGMDPNVVFDDEIPDNEKWLHTPEMKAKLARADEWMRDNPPRETDLAELERHIDETILQLTDEQRPRFEAAARAGEPLPADIAVSFMAQLFPGDQPTYEPDDGPLTEAEINQIREQAAPKLGKGPVLRRRSLLEDCDD